MTWNFDDCITGEEQREQGGEDDIEDDKGDKPDTPPGSSLFFPLQPEDSITPPPGEQDQEPEPDELYEVVVSETFYHFIRLVGQKGPIFFQLLKERYDL